MIVKVQKPIATNDPVPSYLVYDRARTFTVGIAIGDFPDLDKAMRKSAKRFFHASMTRGSLNIDTVEPCPEQDW